MEREGLTLRRIWKTCLLLIWLVSFCNGASDLFAGTNWSGSGADGYNYKTYEWNVVALGGKDFNQENVQACAKSIISCNFNLVRVGWVHDNVATAEGQNNFSLVINWIKETGLNIILVYGGVNGTFGDFNTLKDDWEWIDNKVGNLIWGYDIMNEPYSTNSWTEWAYWAQYWINWFRDTLDSSKTLIIEGAGYATDFTDFTPLSDSKNNLLYEAHDYGWFHGNPTCSNCNTATNCESFCDYTFWYSTFDTQWKNVYDKVGNKFFIGEFGMGRNQGNQTGYPWIPIWYDALVNYIYWRIPGSNFIQFQTAPSDTFDSFSVLYNNYSGVHCPQLDMLYKPYGLLPRPPWY